MPYDPNDPNNDPNNPNQNGQAVSGDMASQTLAQQAASLTAAIASGKVTPAQAQASLPSNTKIVNGIVVPNDPSLLPLFIIAAAVAAPFAVQGLTALASGGTVAATGTATGTATTAAPAAATGLLPSATTVVPVAGVGAAVPDVVPAGSAAIASATAGGAANAVPAAAAAGGAAATPSLASSLTNAFKNPANDVALGLSAVGGALGNKSTSSTTPTLDPAYSPLQQQVLGLVQSRLANGGLPAGFETAGVSAINGTYDAAKTASDQNLVSRGLATSPVAATVDAKNTNARVGTTATFRAGLPLIAQQLQTQDLGLANSVLAQGRGTTTNTDSGGGAAGAATSVAGMLGYLSKQGAFGKQPPAAGAGS